MSNQSRKDRIEDEVIVDCYDEEEVSTAWFYYLAENMTMPFNARIVGDRRVGSLEIGDIVEVIDVVTSLGNCRNYKAIVEVKKGETLFEIPLERIVSIDANEETYEMVEDWRYWCERF
ncbi:hypothetical protein MNB_SV-12-149 [hydrothermal vent metagenome]|uniref:Calcium binding protein from Anabaena CcbP n=1 Tax=hydrothermal vent metagenome TaxID=652676 RepID=A0A1W1BB60_9ZZZZ